MRQIFSSPGYITFPWVLLCLLLGLIPITIAQNNWFPNQQQNRPITTQNGLNCGTCPQGYTRQVLFNSNNNQVCGQCLPQSQSCAPGYVNVGGQCQQCPCPGTDQRRFGTSCRIDVDGQVTCDCSAEYTGRDCGECAPGAVRSSQYPSNCFFLNSTNTQSISCPPGNLCQPPQIQQIVTARPPTQQYRPQQQQPQIQCPITQPQPVYNNYTSPCPQVQCPVVQPRPPQPTNPWIPQPVNPPPCPLLPQPGPGPVLCPTAPAPPPPPPLPPVQVVCPTVPSNGGCPVGPTYPQQPCPPCPVQPPTVCPQCPIQPPTVCPPCPQLPPVVCPNPVQPTPCPTQNCPSPCPTLPVIPPCPTVNCPSPCPTLPTIPECPQCPTPSCPQCPTIPACPQCPQMCPPCPQIPPCNPCPSPCPPCNQQPCSDCPSPCQKCPENNCPDCKLTCNCPNFTMPGLPGIPTPIIVPQIEPCICDLRGVVAQYGSDCFCKDNVQGYKCDSCKPGYFALSEDNSAGCLQCWGSGVSSYCTSAVFYRSFIRTSRELDCSIELTDERNTVVYNRDSSSKFAWDGNEARFSLPVSTRLFWSIPSCLKGNRLTSYGGYLRFERMFTGNGANLGSDNDIMLVGGNGATLYWSSFQSQNSGEWKQIQARLDESDNWAILKGDLSRPATRFDILEVLADIQLILIRATFTTSTSSASIRSVVLSSVSKSATSEGLIFVIEQARCPVGYQGLSCESCALGYYRDITDMTSSVFGACKLCPCGHNADGCHISYGELKCVCKPGYTGDKCQSREVFTVTLDPFWIREIEGAEVDYVCTFTTNSKRTLKMRLEPENSIGNSRVDTEETLRITRTFKLTKAMGRIVCEIVDNSNVVWAVVYGAIILENKAIVAVVPPKSISIVVNTQFICVNETERVKMHADVNQFGSRSVVPEWRKEGKPGIIRTGKVFEIPYARLDDQGTYIVSGSDGDVTNAVKIVLVVRRLDGMQKDDPLMLEGSNDTISSSNSTKSQKETVPKEKTLNKTNKSPSSYLNAMQADQPAEGYPTVIVDPEEVRVRPGESVTLRCNATGEEPLKFYWKSGTVEYMPVHVRVSRGALIFKSIKLEDAGMYYCIAWNNLGQVSARTNVIVENPGITTSEAPAQVEANRSVGAPLNLSISKKHVNSTPGGNVYLRCDSSDPAAKLVWTRKAGELPTSSQILENGTLVLYRVSANDTGTYLCSATSGAGQKAQVEAVLELSPLVPNIIPNLTLTPKSPLKVRSGEKVRVVCSANGYPTPSVKWTRTVDGSDKILASSETNSTVFEIPHVTRADEGKYTCKAYNDAGSKSESWSLSVDDAIICKSSEFRCKSGDQCVSKEDRCDGERDCNDGSDEHHCRKRSRRSPLL